MLNFEGSGEGRMKTIDSIIAGGGWRVECRPLRVKALWFTGLSIIWSGFWVFGALTGLFDDGVLHLLDWEIADWPRRAYGICLWLHPVILSATLVFWFTESPRGIAIHRESPDYDLRKLY